MSTGAFLPVNQFFPPGLAGMRAAYSQDLSGFLMNYSGQPLPTVSYPAWNPLGGWPSGNTLPGFVSLGFPNTGSMGSNGSQSFATNGGGIGGQRGARNGAASGGGNGQQAFLPVNQFFPPGLAGMRAAYSQDLSGFLMNYSGQPLPTVSYPAWNPLGGWPSGNTLPGFVSLGFLT